MTAIIIVLLIVGLVLMTLEVVVIPGFGVAGILGLICLGAGAVLSFMEFGSFAGTMVVIGTLVLGTVMIIFLARSRYARNMELDSSGGKSGVPEGRERWVGKEGEAISTLRPSGTAVFGDERMPVLTEGTFAKKGTRVRVLRVEGGKLVVEPVEEASESERTAKKQDES
jgi:membrane-bound serine protease (ClpP class)